MNKVCLLLLVLLLHSCKSSNNTEVIVDNNQPITIKLFDDGEIPGLNIEKETFQIKPAQSTDYREVLCSEVLDTLWYVKLENTDKSLIGTISDIIYTGEDFIVHDRKTSKILRFSKDGTFLNQISSVGRGPREYIKIGSLECFGSGDNGDLYIGTYGSILRFKLNGDYVESYPLIGERKEYMIIDTSSIAVAQSIRSGDARYRLIIQSFEGDTLETFPNFIKFDAPKNVILSGGAVTNKFYRYDNKIHFQPQYCDTVFIISGAELIPKYIFDLGAFKMKDEWIFEKGHHSIDEIKKNGFYLFNAFAIESKESLFIEAYPMHGGLNISFIYDKTGNKTIAVKPVKLFTDGKKTGVTGYENDFDGGPPFVPQWFSDSYAMGMFNYISTTRKYRDIILRDKYLYPNMRDNLIEIIENYDEDDNPILIIGKYK